MSQKKGAFQVSKEGRILYRIGTRKGICFIFCFDLADGSHQVIPDRFPPLHYMTEPDHVDLTVYSKLGLVASPHKKETKCLFATAANWILRCLKTSDQS